MGSITIYFGFEFTFEEGCSITFFCFRGDFLLFWEIESSDIAFLSLTITLVFETLEIFCSFDSLIFIELLSFFDLIDKESDTFDFYGLWPTILFDFLVPVELLTLAVYEWLRGFMFKFTVAFFLFYKFLSTFIDFYSLGEIRFIEDFVFFGSFELEIKSLRPLFSEPFPC